MHIACFHYFASTYYMVATSKCTTVLLVQGLPSMYYYYSPLCVLWYLLFYWWKYFIGVKSIFYESPLRGCSLSHDRLAFTPAVGSRVHECTWAYFFIQLDPTTLCSISIVHTWSTIEDIMILLQWMMWCIFYVGFVRDPASISFYWHHTLGSLLSFKPTTAVLR